MNSIDMAYVNGMAETFQTGGLSKTAAHNVAKSTASMIKRASLFNFSNSMDGGGGISLSSILIPLIAAGLAGYAGYNAGIEGSRNKSAFTNIKDYLGRSLNKVVRDPKAPAMFNFSSMARRD